MSIFKETFPKFVKEQLKRREKIISSGAGKTLSGSKEIFNFNENRENDFFTYTLNKQCTLRMSSGVNVTDQDLLKDLTNSNQDSLPGETLAEQFILQGGVKTSNLQGGIGEGGAYGDPNLAANSRGDGLGIVPMPGIIDATISTKSAYGSLREAKVKFVAHNKKQLQILETLYMRPGYTLMLEWGWTPYFIKGDNGNPSKQNFIKWVSNFFNANTETQDLENQIFENKTESEGNYDALIGYCKNFSYSLRPDGGFDCETEIISKGEIIESLKDKEFKTTSLSENIDFTYSPSTLIVLEKLRQYSIYSADASNLTLFGSFSYDGLLGAFGSEEKRKKALFEDNLGKDLGFNVKDPNELEDLKKFIITKGDEDEGWSLGTNRDAVRAETSYIRWDALCFLINKHVIPVIEKNIGKPLFLLQTNRLSNDGTKIEPLKYVDIVPNIIKEKAKQLVQKTWVKKDKMGNDEFTDKTTEINWNNADLSLNPQMFQFPHTFFKQPTEELGNFPKKKYNKLFQPLAKQLANTSPKNVVIDGEIKDRDINYSIGGIYIGVEYLISTFKSMYYDEIGAIKDDYSLFNFIKKIWEDINGACNNNHEFDIHVENGASGKILRIVDFIVDAEEIDLDNVHELKIQSLDSTVRDIVYNTNLPSSLSTTIAVAAQAPDSIDNLDQVSFAAISKNIQDRFATPIKTDNTPTQEQIDKWKAKWDASIKSLRSITYTSPKSTYVYLGELNEFVIETDEKANQYSDEDSFEDFSKHRGAAGQVRKCVEYLYKVYGYTDTNAKIYQGQPIPNPTPRLSAVIPLQFNLKLDGISGIVIGNVFKLPKNRLPLSYREDDIYFIVMGEEQSISSKQDWTTSIKGQLILLRKETKERNEINENWSKLNGILTTTLTEKEVREEKDEEDAWTNYVKDTPWSATFISSIVKQAGDKTFPFNASHVNYSIGVKNGESSKWKAIDPLTTPLKHGDIIVKNRGTSRNQFNNIEPNSDSHGDIVVDISEDSTSVTLIGGNLGESVKTSKLATTAGNNKKWTKPKKDANTAAYIPVGRGKNQVATEAITKRNVIVEGEKGSFNVEDFADGARLSYNYFIVLRCSDDTIIEEMLKKAKNALDQFQNGSIKEDDDKVAEIIYSYYLNCNLNPPKPKSLQTS